MAAQGITAGRSYWRAAASAGALYPIDVYAVVGKDGVEEIEAGVFHDESQRPSLSLVTEGELRAELPRASMSQMWVATSPSSFVITAEYNRINIKYDKRGVRYALIEAGHVPGKTYFSTLTRRVWEPVSWERLMTEP